jgi:predicted nuclease with TOPRIM domain
MHLEKVTTRSGESGLAGWIASNDVTLFTMIMVMAIAIFLHSKLDQRAQQLEVQTDENATMSAQLDATASELNSVRDLLSASDEQVRLTQAERDQLQKQLEEKLAALAAVGAKLDALLAEHGQLQGNQENLLATQAALAAEKSTLEGEQATLRERLETLTAQLEQKVEVLAQLEAERDRLRQHADELDAIIATLKKKLDELGIELVAERNLAATVRADALKSRQELEAMIAALTRDKQRLEASMVAVKREQQEQLVDAAENNRLLVGLKGPLKRVAIIVDASGSMLQQDQAGGNRWDEVQQILATWLGHLNVEHCVLVVFNRNVATFPADGTLVDFRGPEGLERRRGLLADLATVKPASVTNTLAALEQAYKYDVDTILLFSDGAPSLDPSGRFDPQLADRVYALCRQHPGVPVNTIGIGNYFEGDLAKFLQAIAQITGGRFQGE